MRWEFDNTRPVYIQLCEQFTNAIISGAIKPGEKRLSVRDLAKEAGVNPNTMQKALSELERSGLLYTQRTAGRFVTENEEKIKEIKQEPARLRVSQFLNEMAQLGIQPQEIEALLAKMKKEES